MRDVELSVTELASKNACDEIEFRLTELKWSMRFWWRTINTFSSVAEMRIKEAILFGHQSLYKSPIILKYETGAERNCPKIHSKSKRDFRIKLVLENRKILHNWDGFIEKFEKYKDLKPESSIYKKTVQQSRSIDFYINLLELSCILGGIGRGSRKNKGILIFKDDTGDKDELIHVQGINKEVGNIKNSDLTMKVMGLLKALDTDKSYELLNNSGEKKIIRKEEYEMQNIEELKPYPYIKSICFYDSISDRDNAYDKLVACGYKKLGIKYFRKKEKDKRFVYPFYSTRYTLYGKETSLIVSLNDFVYSKDLNLIRRREGDAN